MTEADQCEAEPTGTPVRSKPGIRHTRGIRFSDSEWEEVKAAAERGGIPVAEYVRFKLLATACGRSTTDSATIVASLAPLIERTFRYTWMLAPHMRGELIQNGRVDEIEELVKQARDLQDRLQEIEPRQ